MVITRDLGKAGNPGALFNEYGVLGLQDKKVLATCCTIMFIQLILLNCTVKSD